MEHLERLSREKDLPGMPSVRQEFAETFFKRLESAGETLPTWEGELYLEKHQGTYTTQSENKRNNRLCERELHALEFLGAAASCLCPGYEWRSGDVGKIWEKVLLYQFHDILPGSAIDRVYAETDESYAELLESIGRLKEEALEALRKAPGTKPVPSLMNPAPSENGDPVPENGFLRPAAPALPYCFTEFRPLRENGRSTLRSESDVLENDRLLVRFSEKGTLLSVFDKRRREETLSGESNRLLVYPDLCDGWEVPDALESPAQEELTPVSCACGLAGETAFRVYEYKYRDSAVRQTVRLSAGSARIEWETEIDWKEQHTLLRAEFSPAVAAESAVCGVPFGELPRPTMHRDSWEAAKREVCFQGYCDLSDGVRGCAVLSDCRYGIDVRDCRLSLALLRTPTFPAAHADLGRHLLAYAFLPHAGGTDEVRPESFRMRAPSVPLAFLPPLTEPFARAEGLLVSAIKPAEDGDGIVVRFYNPTGRAGKTAIRFAPSLGIVSCFSANLLEEPVAELPPGRELNFGPFEIITVRGKRKKEK